MRDTLVAEIAELERQVSGYTDQLEQTEYGTAKHDAIKAELDKTNAKLTAKQEALADIDGAAQIAQEEVVETFDSLAVPGSEDTIPLAYLLTTDLIPLEDKMSIITSAMQNKLANAAIVKLSLEAEKDRLQVRNDTLETDNTYLTKRNDELDLKAADLESKLHNAGVQIDELKEENGRKESEISKLRDQLSKGMQATSAKVEVESMVEALAKRPAIYDVRWEPVAGPQTHKLANLAETGEEIRFHYFNEGIYRILNKEELLQFREEKEDREHQAAAEAAKLAEEASINPALVIPTLPSFEGPANGLVEGESSEDGTVVTRQEFEDLKRAVEVLYVRANAIEEKVVA